LKFCKLFLLFFIVYHFNGNAQNATITGIVLDESNIPLPDVNITSGAIGTTTDKDGFYILQIIADSETTIVFTHIGHKQARLENLILTTNETYEFNPILKTNVIQVDGVTVTPYGEKKTSGILSISPEKIRKIPGANAGVENILKLLPGVSSNNELSTQYAVRGGNYDENLVYINEIEVYRPFLVRSAQQEGLSFVNSDLVQNVKFSAGGFQAKYGDKLSSVLDITYKKPVNFSAQGDFSLLGASASLESISKNKKLSSITGIRYRNNSLLVNSQQTKGNLNPSFTDVQTYLTYSVSNKFNLNFLGNLSVNNYRNEPITRQTNFGTIDAPKALVVFYEGNENNRFATALGALKGNYYVNDKTTLKLITSLYHTTEEEYSDVIASYELGDVANNLGSENLGEIQNARGIGSQFNRSRNDLDALIFNINHKGNHKNGNTVLEWGLKYTHEDIRDQLRESEFIDSAGFSVRPINPEFVNNQPETPFNAPLVPFTGLSATNFVKTNRFSGFAQLAKQTKWNTNDIYYNLGMRAHYWTVSGTNVKKVSQAVFSPRAQIAIKPDWEKDMLFRFSSGLYHQPPFYRELRDPTGSLGYLKTEENRNGRGFIARPTDQRFKLGILFQDYVATIPDLKMYLNLVYTTGVPGGSPNNADPYIFQNRLRDYKRADLGISYIFAGEGKNYNENHWLHSFKEMTLGFEIFNLFNNQNAITNTWIRDVDSKNEFAVPNFLTSRILNLRLRIRL